MAGATGLMEFGPFRLDAERRLLWRDGVLQALAPRAIDVLAALSSRANEVVTKQELLDRVWPDTFVEEANLSVHVSAVRRALGDREPGQEWIETIPRRGYVFRGDVRLARTTPRSLAVLPFRTLGDKGDLLGTGIADLLIARLGRASQVLVRPTSAVLKYAGEGIDAAAAGRELRVDAVLEGSVQRSAARLRATAQLVDVRTGHATWAETFDADAADPFAVQDAITDHLSRALALQLGRTRATSRPEAHHACLRGRFFWDKLNGPALQKAGACFEEAVAVDPDYALAFSGLADTRVMQALFGFVPPALAWPAARRAAERALTLDSDLPEAHVSLGWVLVFQEWDFAAGGTHLARALELAPASAGVHQWYALFLGMTGRFDDALAEVARAQELDPLSLTVSTNAGFQLYLTQQFEAEVEQHLRTLELDPDYAVAHWALGLAYEQRDRPGDAVASYARALDLSGGSVLLQSTLARAHALAGHHDEARRLLAQLADPVQAAFLSPYRMATVHCALGETEEAISWLERGCRERDHWMVWLAVDPMLTTLRDHPHFPALLDAVGVRL